MAGEKKNKRLKTIENGGIIHNIFSFRFIFCIEIQRRNQSLNINLFHRLPYNMRLWTMVCEFIKSNAYMILNYCS